MNTKTTYSSHLVEEEHENLHELEEAVFDKLCSVLNDGNRIPATFVVNIANSILKVGHLRDIISLHNEIKEIKNNKDY